MVYFRRRAVAIAAAMACVGLFLDIGPTGRHAHAGGNMGGTMNAQLTLQAGCALTGAGNAGSSGLNLGTLDFGTQNSTFTGVITAGPTGGAGGTGATQMTCSPGIVSPSITVSAGDNPGQGSGVGLGSRAMKSGSSYLPYEIYSDAAMTVPYPTAATALGVTLPGLGAPAALPIFAKVNKTNSNAIAAGTYTDVLQVTVSW